MERTRENQRKMPFSSSRRRSRGIVSKESSGIWKVENEGIDSIRERYRIKDYRLNGRTRRSRQISNESSDESFDEEMAEEHNGRTVISKVTLKVYDEIIGVPVPRRARTGLKRRKQDSVIAAEPSNVSKGSHEEMAPISESEVEVAKFLFGLTRLHSQHSDASSDMFQSSSVNDISSLPIEFKRMKPRHLQPDDIEKNSLIIACNSKSDGTTNQVNATSSIPTSSMNGHLGGSSSCIKEIAASSPKLDKISSPNNSGQSKVEARLLSPQNTVHTPVLTEEKRSPISHINSKLFMSPDRHEQSNSMLLKKGDGNSNASCKAQHKQTEQFTEKILTQLEHDLPPLSSQTEKLDPHKSATTVSSVKDCVKKVKYEIDLMALPDDVEVNAANECNPQVSDFNQGCSNDENICKSGIFGLSSKLEIGDSKPKQSFSVLHESSMKVVAKEGIEKQPDVEWKTGSCQADNALDKARTKQHSEKIVKDTALPSGRAGLSNNTTAISATIPISIPCWPGGIRPFGNPSAGSASLSVAPSLQGASPVEANTLIPHAPLAMLPPVRLGHCATHCFIARLTQFQQQLVKLNPFWQAAGSSVSQPGALLLGGPVVRNPNSVTNGSFGSGSIVPLNCQYSAANRSDSLQDSKKGNHLLLQQSHQGGVFLFPINQMQSQTAGQKASHLSGKGSLLPTSSAFSALAVTSASYSKLEAVPDPQYLTMFKGNYPFPNTPAYQSYIAQQQRTPSPLVHGSSNSSRLYSQPLHLTPNPTVSTRSSSRQFMHSPKTSSEALLNKSEHSRNCEVPYSQRTLQNYSLRAGKHCQPLGLLTNQAKTELNHLKKQVVARTNSPISTLSTSVSTASSIAYSDRNKPQERMCSLQRMPKLETSIENTSGREVTPIPYSITAAKSQQMPFSNSVPGHHNSSVQVMSPGSLNMRNSTVTQQAHLSSSMGLTTVAAASLPMKSDEEKPAAG